mmetsp:Transcript_32918/g.104793  ORF Transcript_32918/g.104793 Transcript_32918/m.104793 type:complete len:173 (+) Transcript_32918:123-641(+)
MASVTMRAPVASTSARVASAPSAGRSVLKSFSGMRVQGSVGNATACFQAKAAPAPLAAVRMVTESRAKEAGIGIFGNKAGMTQIFDAQGLAVPVTVIAVQEGNVVTMVKSPETDGYSSVQVRCAQRVAPTAGSRAALLAAVRCGFTMFRASRGFVLRVHGSLTGVRCATDWV